MSNRKSSSDSKRAVFPREFRKSRHFVRDWERLSCSGRYNMHMLKEVMVLLIANSAPLSAEWKDHPLKGNLQGKRECHVGGDLILVYLIVKAPGGEMVIFDRAGTHAEVLSLRS